MTAIAFDRLVVLFNPLGTNAAKAKAIIAELEQAFPGKVVMCESVPSPAGNVKVLQQHLQPGDVLLPCGGDGTVSATIAALLDPAVPKELRRTPVLPVATGRANDIARMVNGKYCTDPLYVLEHASKLHAHPLVGTCKPLQGGASIGWLAMYQLGFGFSGEAAGMLNDAEFRTKQREQSLPVREVELFRAGIQIVKNAPDFDITLEGGAKQSIIDITFVNGPIFASYYRTPVRLSQKEFCYAISTDRSLSNAARTIFELMTNTFSGWNVADSLSFVLHNSVTAHVDGEHITAPAPCKITVSHHKEAVTLLATRADEPSAPATPNEETYASQIRNYLRKWGE